jgi:hypothetical protein
MGFVAVKGIARGETVAYLSIVAHSLSTLLFEQAIVPELLHGGAQVLLVVVGLHLL